MAIDSFFGEEVFEAWSLAGSTPISMWAELLGFSGYQKKTHEVERDLEGGQELEERNWSAHNHTSLHTSTKPSRVNKIKNSLLKTKRCYISQRWGCLEQWLSLPVSVWSFCSP